MGTFTFPLKYRRKSSPPPSPRMLSPIASFSSSFVSPLPKWLDSDDDFDHEPALTSDDALTVFSSSCSRAPSLAPLDAEDAHVDIVSSPVQETFFRAHQSSRAPVSRYNKPYHPDSKSSTMREDIAAALLSLHAQPRLDPSRPVLAQLPTQAVSAEQPPPRRSGAVTPSLRNLVLPRTPSPPPRPSLLLTTPAPLIDHPLVHAPATSAQRTPSRHATPASSPLPPSSPFAEETDCEACSEPSTSHLVPCSKPKSEPLHAHTPSDHPEADNRAPTWSRDESKEDSDNLPLAEHEVLSPPPSLLTEATPNEQHLVYERHPSAPPRPLAPESSAALSPKSGHLREILSPIRGVLNEALEPNGCRSEGTVSSALSLPVQVPSVLQVDGPSPDLTGQDVPTTFYSRAASSALTALDDEHSTPPTSPRDRFAAPSPLSSPPSSPPPSMRRELRSPPPDNASAGRQHPALRPLTESDSNVGSAATLPEPPRSGTKRRGQDTDSNDKFRRKRKKPSSTSVPAHQPCTPASAAPPIPASTSTSTSRASSSTSTSTPDPTATSSTSSITDASANDANDDPTKDPEGDPDNNPACPHPALLGTLIEALALSRASSLPLSTLTRTTPALAGYPHTVIASTLAWAVRSRILGCVRSSGEALPPTYFYDPASDPDRERGELLKCLMPRAGKRRETMKYKQYYWAPVVVGRGRTSAWDVDWEE